MYIYVKLHSWDLNLNPCPSILQEILIMQWLSCQWCTVLYIQIYIYK